MTAGLTLHHIESFRARDVAGSIARIYRDAYDCAEEDARSFINGAFARHTTWPGFFLLVATFETFPTGFIYGYESREGQWWHDTIRPAMLASGQGDWLDDAFELAEIAVVPAMQGRGIGTALVEAFLAVVADRVILLSTDLGDDTRAHDLYLRFGFVDLIRGFQYPGFDDRAIIMGRRPELLHPGSSAYAG